MMTALRPIGAILMDSVRQLRAKRLFWVVLSLSGVVVVAYGSFGFDAAGMTYLYGWKRVDNLFLAQGSVGAQTMMEGIFSAIIVNAWLAWGAMILALVSTAGILPDFLEDGSIDLILAKPITRARIFLTKYVGSLTFVFLQVLIFCIGIFLMHRFRLEVWRWKIFLAVPLIVLMFSYLYSIMALLNILTRSTLASLLITVIAWLGIGGINNADGMLTVLNINATVAIEAYERQIEEDEVKRIAAEEVGNTLGATLAEKRIDEKREEIIETEKIQDIGGQFYMPVHWLAHAMPKTSETVSLLQRALEADAELSFTDIMMGNFGGEDEEKSVPPAGFFGNREIRQETGRRLAEYLDSRGEFYIIGTSLLFEFLLLGLATFIFMRQDF